ncbi:MAG: DUF4149 domain-containing protein [Nitrospirae bacterium]|nr:DUF4149 domain-containing protein [Nitrospirota bacterium]MDA1304453.1 DUF4149 domain-containing protein [Nitrospirota bacterium]
MIESLAYLHVVAIAVLVGKIVFLSFITAPVLARTLDADSFAKVVRQLFPRYYALGMVAAIVGWATITSIGLLNGFGPIDLISSTLWLGILAIENYCRSPLTPKINALSDQLKETERLGIKIVSLRKDRDALHRLSVQLNSLVLIIGFCLIGLI